MSIMRALMDLIDFARGANKNERYKVSLSVDGESVKMLVKELRPGDEFCRTAFYANISFGDDKWQEEVADAKNIVLALLNNE